jgi:peptidoglycan/xylan/chitin deacetylase (PgdA/CDA1 family)
MQPLTPLVASSPLPAARWYAKKLARGGLAAASARPGRASGVRVLTYHRFGERARDPFCLAPRDFATQMCLLAEQRRAISLDDLRAGLAGTRPLPAGAVLVTIDDGNACFWREALPILRDYAIPAVLFVPAGVLEAATAADDMLGIDHVAQLPELGVAIGSHAWSHRSLARLSAAEIEDEVVRSRETLARWTGGPVDSFAYPFGRRSDFSSQTEAALQRAGYSCAFTSQHGAIDASMPPLRLPRIKIEAGEPAWMFARACDGGLDAWGVVDRVGWRWQA